jgi:hypothetical protein
LKGPGVPEHPFLARNGRLVLKKQDSSRKRASIASMSGDRVLPQFIEKCNVVLCRDGRTLLQSVYKQNSIFAPAHRRQHLAR